MPRLNDPLTPDTPINVLSITEGIVAGLKMMIPPREVEDPLVVRLKLRAALTVFPLPISFATPQYVNDPPLWMYTCLQLKIVPGHLRYEFGTAGSFLLAFAAAVRAPYPSVTPATEQRLCSLFSSVCLNFINHPATRGVEDLMLTVEFSLADAEQVFTLLDGALIGEVYGREAERTYIATRERLAPRFFPGGAEDALRRATYKGSVVGDGRHDNRNKNSDQKKRRGEVQRECNRCKEKFCGPFSFHSKTCKGKEKTDGKK